MILPRVSSQGVTEWADQPGELPGGVGSIRVMACLRLSRIRAAVAARGVGSGEPVPFDVRVFEVPYRVIGCGPGGHAGSRREV